MKQKNFKFYNLARQAGQGISEYLIIVALIAVASIGVVGLMGDTVNNQMASMAMEISGQSGATAASKAKAQATASQNKAGKSKTLANFSTDN